MPRQWGANSILPIYAQFVPAFLVAPYGAACVLLIIAGAPKVADPTPLVKAVRSVGAPARPALARLIAVVEIAVGAIGLAAVGRTSAAAVAAAYIVFTVFVVVALRRGGVVSSCGCFGKADTPPSRTHVAVTAAVAVVAAAVAFAPRLARTHPEPGLLGSAATGQGLFGSGLTVLDVAGVALLTFLLWLVLAVLPTTTVAAVRSINARRSPTMTPAMAPAMTPANTPTVEA